MKRNLRDEMPETAAFLDALREAFGKDEINGQIRKGMAGEPTFWARENGHEIGMRSLRPGASLISWDPVTGNAVERTSE